VTTLTDPSSAVPLAPSERVPLMDVLRGFALLGILLMNMEAFVGPLVTALGGIDPTLSGLDRWTDAAIFILVQGKFYTLFSLLFGAGFAMILLRAEQRGDGGGWLYLRRTLVLLAIGLVHALYIWSGDILTIYALFGFVLVIVFRRTPQSRLPKWGIALYVLPMLLLFAFAAGFHATRGDPVAAADFDRSLVEQAEHMSALEQAQRQAYGEGSYAEANAQRRADLAWMMGMLPIFGPLLLGIFLIGAWLLRSGALLRPHEHLALFRRLRNVGLGAGLPLMLWSVWMVPTADHARMDVGVAAATSAMMAANLLLSLAYVSIIALALQLPQWRARLLLLAPAGRMALTNYLMQSIICVAIFYSYGLGFFEQLPRFWQVPFALVLYTGQVALSHWWLARFRFGPAEWLWRSLTYLQAQPMRARPVPV
jgi:uncharacterized protein